MPPLSTPPSERVRVRRLPDRARYDRGTVHRILDDGFVAHVGLAVDGQPYVLPFLYARDGDLLYLHGATTSRTLRAAGAGLPLCVTVTQIDGLVLARSAFHHSANYRSVVVLGTARLLRGERKLAALRALTEHVTPGRWDSVRPPTRRELRATAVLALDLTESSAKVRTGGPSDAPEDLDAPVWAGVIPLRTVAGPAVPADDLAVDLAPPELLIPGVSR